VSRGGRRPDCAGQTARQLPLNTHTADDGRLAVDRATAVAVRSTVRAIPTGPDAPAIAREAIAETGAIADPSARYQAQLLISELVSHRVRVRGGEQGGTLGLKILLTPGHLRVEVGDDDSRPEIAQLEPGEPTLGWELQLVAELADRWGIRHHQSTVLWFELNL